MYRIGIDLGGTNIAVGLVNESFEIVSKASVPTSAGRPSEEIVKDMADLCKRVCADAGIAENEVASVGIAAPGTIDSDAGTVLYSNNLGWQNFPIVSILKSLFPVPAIYIENDANAAAWGEAVAGAAKGSSSSVMITLGTGVGGGVVDNGKILKGFNSAGGELGHIVISVDGRPCTCGRHGCWEAYSSATGLIRTTKEKIEECKKAGRPTKMTDLAAERGKVNGRTAFDAMRLGDEPAKEVVTEYVKYLASGLTSMINIFQPEVLSIGGGISNEGDFLLDLLRPLVLPQTFGVAFVPRHTSLRIAKLKNDAGIIGAAVLGM